MQRTWHFPGIPEPFYDRRWWISFQRLRDHAMRWFSFPHQHSLLILVLILGVGFAALRESDETLHNDSIFSLTLVMLSISILLAVHRTEKRRHSGWGSLCLGGPTSGCRWSRQSNPGCSRPRLAYLDPTFQTDLS